MKDAAPPEPELLARTENGVGRLTINRPGALGALTLEMCRSMTRALLAWRGDEAISAVLIDHAGERGFCAGGDIRFLAESGAAGDGGARDFFLTEYRLNHLLFTYPKPVVAIMDGITMGGGVGISAPARWRIATERTVFAMPETGIGLFPDVGGGWRLPRFPGQTGIWLALTGARLGAADCLALGIATSIMDSRRTEDLKSAIVNDPLDLDRLLGEFAAEPVVAPIASVRAQIDALFSGDSVEAVLDGLDRAGTGWAGEQAAILATKSPLSLKVTLRQLRAGAAMATFADEMAVEMRIAARMVQGHDFAEGVRAVIVEKDNLPRWDPADLAHVTPAMLDAIFAPLPADQEWTPL